MKANVDRALAKRLDEAGDRPVEAVFQLRPSDRARTRKVVNKIVDQAQVRASSKADAVTIFENLHSFAARGAASLIKELANCEEVRSAHLNPIAEDVLIRPVRSKRVAAKDLKKYTK